MNVATADTAVVARQLGCVRSDARSERESGWIPWILLFGDAVAIQLAVLLAYFTRRALLPLAPIELGPDQYSGLALGVLLLPLRYCLAGLYPGYGRAPVERLRLRTQATLLLFGALVSWDYLVLHGAWSRGMLLATLLYALLIPPAFEAALVHLLIRAKIWGTPVVILGAGSAALRVIRNLRRRPELGYLPIAALDNRQDRWGMDLDGVPVLGPLALADELARTVKSAIVAMPWKRSRSVARCLHGSPFRHLVFVPSLGGLPSQWITTRDLDGTLGLELKRNLLLKRSHFLKRFLDFALVIPFFIAAAPLVAVLAACIRSASPGSPFYAQRRIGKNGREFRVWKLRTMYPDAENMLARHLAAHPREREEWERFFKLKNDPRILPGIGSFLRKSSLDELPQLWNVLRGEMSLVGPRPFPEYHLQGFRREFRELRASVLPGLTGFWQISDRSNGDLRVQQDQDTYYIRNWSPWLDLYILVSTIRVVVFRQGAY